jgi:uncharacterized protein (DUF433 family)
VKSYREIISIQKGKRGGKPCIRNLRITVYDVLGWMSSGMSKELIIEEHPDLTQDDLNACLSFAADRERVLASA